MELIEDANGMIKQHVSWLDCNANLCSLSFSLFLSLLFLSLSLSLFLYFFPPNFYLFPTLLFRNLELLWLVIPLSSPYLVTVSSKVMNSHPLLVPPPVYVCLFLFLSLSFLHHFCFTPVALYIYLNSFSISSSCSLVQVHEATRVVLDHTRFSCCCCNIVFVLYWW